jgi:hypothetical protein
MPLILEVTLGYAKGSKLLLGHKLALVGMTSGRVLDAFRTQAQRLVTDGTPEQIEWPLYMPDGEHAGRLMDLDFALQTDPRSSSRTGGPMTWLQNVDVEIYHSQSGNLVGSEIRLYCPLLVKDCWVWKDSITAVQVYCLP